MQTRCTQPRDDSSTGCISSMSDIGRKISDPKSDKSNFCWRFIESISIIDLNVGKCENVVFVSIKDLNVMDYTCQRLQPIKWKIYSLWHRMRYGVWDMVFPTGSTHKRPFFTDSLSRRYEQQGALYTYIIYGLLGPWQIKEAEGSTKKCPEERPKAKNYLNLSVKQRRGTTSNKNIFLNWTGSAGHEWGTTATKMRTKNKWHR